MSRSKSYQKPYLGRVIVVEDDELLALKLGKDLSKKNINHILCSSYEEAMEHIDEGDSHAVVSDMYLNSEEPNGLKVVEYASNKGLPVVIITSALDLNIAKQGLNLGADHILEKPFEVEVLKKVLEDLWENPKGLIGRRERCFDRSGLTQKEREFARLILKGLSNKEIAEVMETTVSTVKFYTNQIFEKSNVGSRGELFNYIFPT
ncbi:response regulator [bacterium]|nr:response regulator [bacterium]